MWTRVKVGLKDPKVLTTITYDQRSPDWKQVLNYIYIPREDLNINKKYPLKVRARDESGVQIKATVVVVVSEGRVYVSDIKYSYNQTFKDDFYNSGAFEGKPNLIVI